MTTHLVDAANLTAKAMKELSEENARNLSVMEAQQKLIGELQAECSILREYLKKTEHERDFYRTYSVEIVTKLTVIQDVIDDACTKAQHAAYAPPAINPPKAVGNGVDIETAIQETVALEKPIPKFLTKPKTGKEARS